MKLGAFEVPGFYTGDARAMCGQLPGKSIQCAVFSPPYWGLRTYGGDQGVAWSDGWNGPWGGEATPEAYVAHTIEVLEAVRLVLRDDGLVFVNVGDSYYNNASNHQPGVGHATRWSVKAPRINRAIPHNVLKPKDLCLVPFHVAIAAQRAGWWVRSMIVWAKGASLGSWVGNPVPDTAPDRPGVAHEFVIMLAKSPRYYWNHSAVSEPAVVGDGRRTIRDVWTFCPEGYSGSHFATFPRVLPATCIRAATPPARCVKCGTPWIVVEDRAVAQCKCQAPGQLAVVLDPCCGSGTTCAVADGAGRLWLGFDVAGEYKALQDSRIGPLLPRGMVGWSHINGEVPWTP